ncbi:MAG: glycosyltransferase family 4 protein [Elusimicrobiales bacterium]|nr:glycosyltransferase family 4 protein [Elusimicrobiales bacterium]
MKILFLTHYYPPEGNAPAARVHALASRWARHGHDVTVVTCAPNVPAGKVYEGYENRRTDYVSDGVRIIRVKTYIAPNKGIFKRMLNFVSYMFSAFYECIFMKKPDIMIATSPQFFCGWAGVLLHWFRRFPFLLEIRDIWPESITAVGARVPGIFLKILGVMEKIMYSSAAHIVTVGEGYKQRLIERGVPSEKISIIMNGADFTVFHPAPKNKKLMAEYGLSGKFVCCYTGTLGMACGLKTVLEAAEIIKNKGIEDIAFALVGDGAVRTELENKCIEKKIDNVVFTGLCPKKEIPEWINSCDVTLAHLKKTELFKTVIPSKIFESAACAKPILMGVQGNAAEIIDKAEAGISFEPENPSALIDALLKFYNDRNLLRKAGENAANNIAAVHNRDRQAKDYIEIIKDKAIKA